MRLCHVRSFGMCRACVQYLAPEVLKKLPYDKTVDWWCLGAVLYEMVYGLVGDSFISHFIVLRYY